MSFPGLNTFKVPCLVISKINFWGASRISLGASQAKNQTKNAKGCEVTKPSHFWHKAIVTESFLANPSSSPSHFFQLLVVSRPTNY
jgi:hypothetical protein